jgi:hypothetical protein
MDLSSFQWRKLEIILLELIDLAILSAAFPTAAINALSRRLATVCCTAQLYSVGTKPSFCTTSFHISWSAFSNRAVSSGDVPAG